ncbi:MAG: hypothetical protein IJ447_04905 [Clostridia bacterium]|nr:hypothetical protein [Clostridia bacterium]
MKNNYLYITNEALSKNSSRTDLVLDRKLGEYYHDYYETDYDLELLVTRKPIEAAKNSPIYNDIYEKIGSDDITVLKDSALKNNAKRVKLTGFKQEHFDYIAPYIKETTELLYLFKCPKIKDLSALSDFPNLKCLSVYWNNSLEKLWNMENNRALEVLSFVSISKLRDVSSLKNSNVKYITFDSTGIYPNRKELLIEDMSVFEQMPQLEHLKLLYKKCDIDY